MKNLILFFIWILSWHSYSHAGEWLTQIYGGNGWTERHNAYVVVPNAGLSATHKQLSFDSAPILGIRESCWFHPYVGLGLDASFFFGPDQKKQISSTCLCIEGIGCSTSPELIQKFKNNVTAVGPSIIFRYPLLIAQQDVQPYIGAGPTLFIARLRDTDNFIPARQVSNSNSIGVKAYAGFNLFFNQLFGTFVEYQLNSFTVKTTYYNEKVVEGITLGKTKGKQTFTIQSIVIGIAIRL
jgi:outer membrane protein W